MTHAHHAKIDTGKSYTLLLDELDGTVASYCTQARPYHWAHLVSGYRNLQAPKDSFLSLAVQFGLDLYVQQKLQEVGLEERSKLNHCLVMPCVPTRKALNQSAAYINAPPEWRKTKQQDGCAGRNVALGKDIGPHMEREIVLAKKSNDRRLGYGVY
jgi:hypothetical protein